MTSYVVAVVLLLIFFLWMVREDIPFLYKHGRLGVLLSILAVSALILGSVAAFSFNCFMEVL